MLIELFCPTGTNFLVRSNCFAEVGGSPTYTLTEDFALGMELKKKGWHCRYVQEYLAIGEAPDQIRNCYQQRSRWCKVRSKNISNDVFSAQAMPQTMAMSYRLPFILYIRIHMKAHLACSLVVLCLQR